MMKVLPTVTQLTFNYFQNFLPVGIQIKIVVTIFSLTKSVVVTEIKHILGNTEHNTNISTEVKTTRLIIKQINKKIK